MALPLLNLPMTCSSSSHTESPFLSLHHHHHHHQPPPLTYRTTATTTLSLPHHSQKRRHRELIFFVGKEDTELRFSTEEDENEEEEEEEEEEPTPDDLEYISQINRVVELLKKNRDMLFSEVKLTISIEDPREVERRRLLGIEDPDTPTRDDLADALEDVNEGKVPKNRAALRMLAEEMVNWPNLEVEATKKKPSKSLYAKATDTGVDPKVAAKRLKVDWDSAAEIDDDDDPDEIDVPSAVGFGALYLVSAFPIIIGVSVVLILFYNSLQ